MQNNNRLWLILVSANSDLFIDIIMKNLNHEQQVRITNRKSDVTAFLKEYFMSMYIDDLRQNITREGSIEQGIAIFFVTIVIIRLLSE